MLEQVAVFMRCWARVTTFDVLQSVGIWVGLWCKRSGVKPQNAAVPRAAKGYLAA